MDNRVASSGCNRQTKTSALPTQVTNAQQLRRQSSPLGSLVDQQFPAAALSRHTYGPCAGRDGRRCEPWMNVQNDRAKW
jgi:hypothetical protein